MNKWNQSTTTVPLNKVLKSQMLTQGPAMSWQLIQECTLHLTQTILKKMSICMENLLCQVIFFPWITPQIKSNQGRKRIQVMVEKLQIYK